jgi:hypothetical protein
MSRQPAHSRRHIIKSVGALVALGASPIRFTAAADSDVTGRLARYMVSARDTALPESVMIEAKNRILDTFGAMVSGARMDPGIASVKYVKGLGGTEEACIRTCSSSNGSPPVC